jgi:hypothetical protein
MDALTNDPAVMADPYTGYARWRQAGPVLRASTPDGLAVWEVTRYDDVASPCPPRWTPTC